MTAEELKNIFEGPYTQQSWITVLREVFGIKNILIKPQVVDTTTNNWDAKGFELGSFETLEGRLVGVYEVQISDTVKLERNKVGLRNLLKPIYDIDVDAALIVFNQGSRWRFSYVSQVRVRNKETNRREKKTTDPKRYTYIFGKGQKCRTAAERFAKIQQHYNLFGGAVKLEEIEKAFSVDTLTKDFYRELSDWYFRALKEVKFPDDAERAINPKLIKEELEKEEKTRNATNTIRLITRLIFVWFLKQKNLVPDELFDKNEIDKIINYKDKTGSTYYKAILQNLFFATLNTEMGDENRKFIERQYGVQTFYRYKRFFKNTERFLELTKNIPFLNGGLFENLDKDIEDTEGDNKIRIDCFSNALKNEGRLTVPDSLFFDEETVDLSEDYGDKKKKGQKVRGLVNILQSYNFTIEENTPFEIEVALDPELLGKVFENLLASYNPETESTARKMTGSFYTPREIVDYMTDESLKAYLANILPDLPREKLNQLFSYSTDTPAIDTEEKKKLILALDEAKILDPACGSGAFPMGVLHKMVLLLNKLDPDNKNWKEIQRKKAIEETEEAFRLGNKADRDERLQNISEAFEDNSDDYGRKLYLIENCIYGVDIQPIAVQIAKLRFFISLICDQEVNDTRKNRGVRPLPNLETKFVAANTLIGLNKPKQLLLRNPKIEELEAELNEVRHKHFSARTSAAKRKWRTRDNELREQIGELLKYDGWDNTTAERISNWNPYDQNTFADFFDNEWMFGILEGFDIILGNPPYIQLQKEGGRLAKQLEKIGFETFERTGDIYSIFYERGVMLLNEKGFLCYITSNKWMRANYGASTRQFFADKTYPILLIDFGNIQVFETATVDTNILLLQNKPKAKKYEPKDLMAVRITNEFNLIDHSLDEYVRNNYYVLTSLSHNAWVVGEKDIYNIKDYVEKKGVPLNTWDLVINYGLKTGLNEAFIITAEVKNKLVEEDANSVDVLKPILRGKDISAWYPDFADLWLIYIPWHFPLHEDNSIVGATDKAEPIFRKKYKAVFNHLSKFKLELAARNKAEVGIRYEWFALQRFGSNYWRDFEKPKIIYPNMTKFMPFVYDEKDHFYSNDKSFILLGKYLKYLTCFFNSKLFKYCFSDNFPELQGGTRELRKIFFDKIPVKQISSDQEAPYSKMVDYLISFKKANSQDNADQLMFIYFEQVVNALVFELYFEEEFERRNLVIAKHIAELPDLNENEQVLHQLRKIYVSINQDNHPVKQSMFSMLSIPQIELVINSVEI